MQIRWKGTKEMRHRNDAGMATVPYDGYDAADYPNSR
jgi:hypothetical protein